MEKNKDIDIGKIFKKVHEIYRDDSGLDIKLPKFNLKKIDAKEVLRFLNSGDKENRKKAVSLLFDAYSKRYLELAHSVADSKQSDPYAFIWERYWQVTEHTRTLKTEDEEVTQFETEKNEALSDIFGYIENDETKPTSEKEIGAWLDNAVKNYANDKMRFNGSLHCYWAEPPQDVFFIAFASMDMDRQPFNLEKIDAKEVLRLLNSGDKGDREKAVTLLFEAYGKRYIEKGREVMVRIYPPEISEIEPLDFIYDIFHSLNNKGVQTKPTSEEEIGEWLDNFVMRALSGCFK